MWARAQRREPAGRGLAGHEVDFVEQNLVGKGNLLHGLVDTLLVELLVVKMLHQMLAICETNDGIDGVLIEQFGIGSDKVRQNGTRKLGKIQEIRTRDAIPPCVYYMYTAIACTNTRALEWSLATLTAWCK